MRKNLLQHHRSTNRARKEGSALVVILWLVGILSLLVTTMAFEAHLEAKVISHSRKKIKADYMVRSGIDIAELLMRKSDMIVAGKITEDEGKEDRWHSPAERLSHGLRVAGLREKIADGEVIVDIEPEPGRRNVNILTDEDWERVLDVGNVPVDMWPVLIDSFQDWIDRDNDPRRDGAETDDYYATLEPPYRAKNGPVDSVDELLLVKGFGRAIVYGGIVPGDEESPAPRQMTGIGDLLTVYGDGKVNVNAASHRVLMTLPGVDDIIAGAIIEEREGLPDAEGGDEYTSFKSPADIFRRIPELDPKVQRSIVTSSQIYRITAESIVGGVSSKIWCVGSFNGVKFDVLRWQEQ